MDTVKRIAFLALGMLVIGRVAYACSCLPPAPPKEALEKTDRVFLGVVERNEAKGTPYKIDMDDGWQLGYPYKEATFRVITVWKGPSEPVVNVTTSFHSSMCGYDFQVGSEYVVYATEHEGTVSANICSRTRLRHEAQQDLEELGKGTPVLSWKEVPNFP
ncbi:MAG: hypothetical protein HYY57_06740 [Candidatus Omnitrophica bacterium]|nr:hypothetical protein [Candidatus Omnitrophota bacterium]